MVLGESVFVNFEICSSISFSIVRCACSSGNSQITVEIWGVCGLRHAVNRTPSALPMSSGQRVCKIDSNSSHSSVEGKVLIKILVNIITLFSLERLLTGFKVALDIWLSKQIIIRSVKTALFVGTTLAFINHGDLIVSGSLTPQCWIKMGLTCLVPYSVASWTATKAKLDMLSA